MNSLTKTKRQKCTLLSVNKTKNKDWTVARGNWTIARETGQQHGKLDSSRRKLDSSARKLDSSARNWTVARGTGQQQEETGQQQEETGQQCKETGQQREELDISARTSAGHRHPYFLGWPNIFSKKIGTQNRDISVPLISRVCY